MSGATTSMEATAGDAGRVASPPPRWGVDRRFMGIAMVTEIVAVGLAYMVVFVPVLGPKLTRAEANRHWLVAVAAATVVGAFGLLVVRAALAARRRTPASRAPEIVDRGPARALPRIPLSLRFERVPNHRVRLAAALSLATLPLTIGLNAPLWLIWLSLLAPWTPIVVVESRHKLSYDAVFASFGLMVILQLLHMVEHTTQVLQLLLTGGSFARSHGVIGQLDFETVHFVADSGLWISLGLMMIAFRARNKWLWVAFAAASLHEIEHLYLFWLYVAENTVYISGGAAGIMGRYGLIGSPLYRPYLHYAYNFVVFVPLLIAFWDQARHVDGMRLSAP